MRPCFETPAGRSAGGGRAGESERAVRGSVRFLAQRHRAVPRVRRRAGIARDDERRFAAALDGGVIGGSIFIADVPGGARAPGLAIRCSASRTSRPHGMVASPSGTRTETSPRRLAVLARELGAPTSRPGRPRRSSCARVRTCRGEVRRALESTGARMSRLGRRSESYRSPVDEMIERIDAGRGSRTSERSPRAAVLARAALAGGVGPDEQRSARRSSR